RERQDLRPTGRRDDRPARRADRRRRPLEHDLARGPGAACGRGSDPPGGRAKEAEPCGEWGALLRGRPLPMAPEFYFAGSISRVTQAIDPLAKFNLRNGSINRT